MNTQSKNTEEKKSIKDIKLGDLVSAKLQDLYIKGIVEKINNKTLIINNYKEGKIEIPKEETIKMFPGQKFDIRELSNTVSGYKENDPKLPLTEKIGSFLSRTDEFKGMKPAQAWKAFLYDSNHKKDLLQLLAGRLTHNKFNGTYLKEDPKTKIKTVKNWSAKLQLFKNKYEKLNIDLNRVYKRETLSMKAYNTELTKDQQEKVKKGNLITLEISNKENKFKIHTKLDKELNRLIHIPYSETIDKKIKNKQAASLEQTKKSSIKKTTKQTPKKPTKKTHKL